MALGYCFRPLVLNLFYVAILKVLKEQLCRLCCVLVVYCVYSRGGSIVVVEYDYVVIRTFMFDNVGGTIVYRFGRVL